MPVAVTEGEYDEDLLTHGERKQVRLSAPEAVSGGLVNALRATYSLPRNCEADLRLLRYLILNPWQEKKSKAIILSNELIAYLTDRESAQWHDNLRGDAYLDQFAQRFGIALDIAPSSQALGRARTLAARLPKELRELFDREGRLEWHQEGLIWLDGMRVLNRANRQLFRAEMQCIALGLHARALCPVARRWLDYLNNLPPNRFTSLLKRMDAVREDILRTTSGPRQKQALRVLANIWAQPQPFYRPTSNSVRLYGTCENLTSLSKNWRKVLAPDWIEADLRNCYLAIGATLWDIQAAKEFLASGRSVWPMLCGAVGVPLTSENKKVMKRVFYGLFFGMKSPRMRKILHDAFGKGADTRFVQVPLVKAILEARSQKSEEIRSARAVTDCFGRELSTSTYKVRSIQAQMMQAVEMLLEPALELFETQRNKHGATCTLLQHDGFSFVSHDKADADEWKRRLQGAVQARAVAMGINTKLEFDPPIGLGA